MATLVSDSFGTGTAGDDLTTRAPDIAGSAWARSSGASHSGNEIEVDGAGNAQTVGNSVREWCYLATPGSASADQTASCEVERTSSDGMHNEIGVVARCADDGSSHYRAFTAQGSSFRLVKRVGGSDTQLGQFNITIFNGERYRIILECLGTAIKVYTQRIGTDPSPVERISVTDSDVSAAGKAGIWAKTLGGAWTSPGPGRWNAFTLDGSAGGGPTLHQQTFTAASTNAGEFPVLARTTSEGFSAASVNAGTWSPVKIPGGGGGEPTLHQQTFTAASSNAGVWAAMLRSTWDPTPLPPAGRRGPKHRQRKQRGSHA